MTNHSSFSRGTSAVAVIAGVAGLAVLIAIVVTTLDSEVDDRMQAAQDRSSGLEMMAETRATAETEAVNEAVAERSAELEAAMSATAPANDTTPATAPESDASVTTEANTGVFTDYTPELLAADTTNVLFFHADWCPSCRGLENDINANRDDIPENVAILKVDFDTETELKKKYGIVRQHTLVVVDANGNEIKKLTGLTNTLDQVASQL